MRFGRLLLTACGLVAAAPLAAQELQLERVVLLSRHGVRAPTQPLAELDKHVATPWARWPVGPAELTPRGAELMTLMGGYYRVLYGGRGLLPADHCPAAGAVAAWADVSQRTRLTAQALLDGLYPRCGLKAWHQAEIDKADPLFHPPPRDPACPFDQAEAKAAVQRRLGDFPSILQAYAAPLATTQAILCPPGAAGRACGLRAEASEVAASRDGGIAMRGPIGIGSTAVEIFQLEAAQGMPREQVAWGRLKDDVELAGLMSIHVLQFDLMQRTGYVARRQGSRLLAAIAATLRDGLAFPGAERGAQPARLALLVGHDTNIVNVAGLLEIGWAIAGMHPDDPSPGSALAFELLRDPNSGQRWVGVAYHAQTVEQMRTAVRLDLDRPAGHAIVQLPGCKANAKGTLCPLARFIEIAQAAIDTACVP